MSIRPDPNRTDFHSLGSGLYSSSPDAHSLPTDRCALDKANDTCQQFACRRREFKGSSAAHKQQLISPPPQPRRPSARRCATLPTGDHPLSIPRFAGRTVIDRLLKATLYVEPAVSVSMACCTLDKVRSSGEEEAAAAAAAMMLPPAADQENYSTESNLISRRIAASSQRTACGRRLGKCYVDLQPRTDIAHVHLRAPAAAQIVYVRQQARIQGICRRGAPTI